MEADFARWAEELSQKLDNTRTVTILTHLNPDADTLGTALGIYHLLTKYRKELKIEIANASKELPRYLDFLPHFGKIKHKMDYTDRLIISCDCGSVERLGFALEGRQIVNIDHHQSNTMYGTLNVVVPHFASSSQVAYALFKQLFKIDGQSATCFYAALLSDTRSFTTSSVNEAVFQTAKELVECGVDAAWVAQQMTQRHSLASVRILQRALDSMALYFDATVAILYVTKDDIQSTGATVPDMDGIVEYARSLATIRIAVFVMELDEGLRVSLRSKGEDVSTVAAAFGGGGHKVAAGFTLPYEQISSLQETIATIAQKIKALELV